MSNRLTVTSNHTWSFLFTAYFFLAIILQLPIPKTRLNSIPLLPSSRPGRLASRNSTQFFSNEISFLTTLYVTRRKHSLFYWKGVFIAPLLSNGSYSIVACVCVAAGMCLPSHSIEMAVYSDFTIPTFGRQFTIYIYIYTSLTHDDVYRLKINKSFRSRKRS
jgi:hypothetical protein